MNKLSIGSVVSAVTCYPPVRTVVGVLDRYGDLPGTAWVIERGTGAQLACFDVKLERKAAA